MKKVIEDILNNMILPEYNNIVCGFDIKMPDERFDVNNELPFVSPSITVNFIGGYGTKYWPKTMAVRDMYDDILNEIWDVIHDYTNIGVDLYMRYIKECNETINESKEEKEQYSPAGKEITPKDKVFHQSNPLFRDKIKEQGLRVRAGECYKIYAGYGEKCIPAIFATNSSNKRAWFDSTYDDDVWEIDTTKIPNVKWYKDRHYESRSKHIVTFDNIPNDAIKLIYQGSGKDSGQMNESKKDNEIERNLNVINVLLEQVSWNGLCNIWVDYNEEEDEYEIRSKTTISSFVSDEIEKELDSLYEIAMSLGNIRVYIYTPWYVKNCEDEPEFLNESKKENSIQQELRQIIDDNDIFEAINLVGGVDNLRTIFKNDTEINKILDDFKGEVDFLFNYYSDIRSQIVFPLQYEIIGIEKNVWGTNSWPVINLIYDESKLTSEEKDKFMSIISKIVNDDTVGKIKTKLFKDPNFFHVAQINGKDVVIHEIEFEFSRKDVIRIYNKLYGDSENINESKTEKSKLKLVKDLIYEFFDEVSFIEQKKYHDKTLIKVYFESDDPAFNMDSWLVHQIKSKINEYTSGNIILVPRWHSPVLDFDFYIDAEKITYDDEGNVINESEKKKSNYINVIEELVEPFKEEDCVCDITVSYDEEDDMYSVYFVLGTEELNDKFLFVPAMTQYASKLRNQIKNTIKSYLPIDNIYVGSYGQPNCDWKPNIREAHKVDKNDYIELYRDKEFILTIPLTHEASKKYGSDTKWCTTKKDCDKDFQKHIEMGVLGYIVVRDNELKERLGSNAFALYRLKGDDLTRTIAFDDHNNEYRNGESWLGNKFDRVDKLFQFYKLMNKYNDYFEKQELDNSIIESKEISKTDLEYNNVNKVLNRVMESKHDWWKGIEINDIVMTKNFKIALIRAVLKVDKEWGAEQWGEYNMNMSFPGNDGWEDNETYELVTLGDIIGGNLADDLSEQILDVLTFTGVSDPNIKSPRMSFRSIMLKFI